MFTVIADGLDSQRGADKQINNIEHQLIGNIFTI